MAARGFDLVLRAMMGAGTPVILPPVADFSGTPLSGRDPLTVTFTDLSTNTPTSWHWEKNDGGGWVDFDGTPTAQNPVEDLSEGMWDIRLTATNAGGSDSETKTAYAEVTPGRRAFVSASGEATDQSGQLMVFKGSNGKMYLPGENSDRVWEHDPSGWVGTAVQLNPGHTVRTSAQAGAMSDDGNWLWLSADTPFGGYPVTTLEVNTGTFTDFNIGDYLVMGANADQHVQIHEGGGTDTYDPNFSTHTLGTAVHHWAVDTLNSAIQTLDWDGDGWGWTWANTHLYRFKASESTYHSHVFPNGGSGLPTMNGLCAPMWDLTRNQIVISLEDQSGGPTALFSGLWTYTGWNPGFNDGGTWTQVTTDIGHRALCYDPITDIWFCKDTEGNLRRYDAETFALIDVVDQDGDTTFTDGGSRKIQYTEGKYGWVVGFKAGTYQLERVEYTGAIIP